MGRLQIYMKKTNRGLMLCVDDLIFSIDDWSSSNDSSVDAKGLPYHHLQQTTISNRTLCCIFVVFPMLYRCLKIFFHNLPMDHQLVPEVFGSLQMIINNLSFVSNWSLICIFVLFPMFYVQYSSHYSSVIFQHHLVPEVFGSLQIIKSNIQMMQWVSKHPQIISKMTWNMQFFNHGHFYYIAYIVKWGVPYRNPKEGIFLEFFGIFIINLTNQMGKCPVPIKFSTFLHFGTVYLTYRPHLLKLNTAI